MPVRSLSRRLVAPRRDDTHPPVVASRGAARRRLLRRAGRRSLRHDVRRHVRPGGRRAGGRFPGRAGRVRRALELGIGTGRIAVPLARRGVAVHGIDLSTAMTARLRAKPGGEGIGVTIGDFATTGWTGSFRLAYLVFNTIMNLTSQAAQVACFRNVAAHLEPGGASSSRSACPDLRRLPPGETVRAYHVSADRLGHRRVRRRAPGPDVAPLPGRRRAARRLVGPVPLRLARRSST